MMASPLLIMGSVRAGRHCPAIADWVQAHAGDLALARIDLRDWPLPADDEPAIPATGRYEQDHTRAWSRTVAAAPGYVILTPQYNWGYPAPLKNALDHLYKEWAGKPLLIITYGGHGGGKCAAQLRQVAEGMKMRPVAAMPGLTLPEAVIRGAALDPAAVFANDAEAVRVAFAEFGAALATEAAAGA